MSQKNETPVLLLSLLITLALIGGGLWWLGSRFTTGNLPSVERDGSSNGDTSLNRSGSFSDRFSAGTRLLIAQDAPPQKRQGITALADGNYSQSVADLEASLQENRNDPEALIYLNNARIGDQRSYTIAVSVPVNTSLNTSLEILRGVAQAQNEVNQQGGINGVPLKVLIVNDDNDPEVVKQVAETLVQDDSILGVVGHFGSGATLAAAEIYQPGGLVMVSPTSTSVEISNEGDYIFRTVPSDRFTASTLASYMLDTLRQQNAVVYYNSESDYSLSLKNQFTTSLTTEGGQVVEEVDVANPSFNAPRALEQATQRGADVIVLATDTPKLDQALQVIQANNQQLPLLGGDSLYNPRVLEDGQADALGMVVAVPWIIGSNLQSPFVQSSQQLWKRDVNWRTAMAYDATQVLVKGLEQDPTRQGVQQALADPNFELEGATGTVRFLSSGDRNQPMQLAIVAPGSRSGFGYDFAPAQ